MENQDIPTSQHVLALSQEEMMLLLFIPNEKIVSESTTFLRKCTSIDVAVALFFAPLLIQGIITEKIARKKKFHISLQPFVKNIDHHSVSTIYRRMHELTTQIRYLKKKFPQTADDASLLLDIYNKKFGGKK